MRECAKPGGPSFVIRWVARIPVVIGIRPGRIYRRHRQIVGWMPAVGIVWVDRLVASVVEPGLREPESRGFP